MTLDVDGAHAGDASAYLAVSRYSLAQNRAFEKRVGANPESASPQGRRDKMTPEYALKADRDVVASWIVGWAISRGVAAPVKAYDGFRVDVGLPDQKARYVFAEASLGVEMASSEIGEPNIFIKVCAPPQAVEPLLASRWSIESVSFMMTADDLYRTNARHPGDYQYKLEPMPGGYMVTAHAEDGATGASGRVSLVGSTAVFDQIETHPDHRRRGLGRAIMSELGAAAFRNGATKGSLVATPDGRALYSTLGWRLHSLFTTAVRG